MSRTMLFNPYTGKPRDPRDIQSDPEGILMLDPDEPLHAAAPPATSAELVALIEAVDTLLESAPCECPHRMREERGEHLSHCYLFDLNVARSAAGSRREAPGTP